MVLFLRPGMQEQLKALSPLQATPVQVLDFIPRHPAFSSAFQHRLQGVLEPKSRPQDRLTCCFELGGLSSFRHDNNARDRDGDRSRQSRPARFEYGSPHRTEGCAIPRIAVCNAGRQADAASGGDCNALHAAAVQGRTYCLNELVSVKQDATRWDARHQSYQSYQQTWH
eukprot:751473-Hanusia_phi.AAC.3